MSPLAALLNTAAGPPAGQSETAQPTEAAASGGLFAALLEAANAANAGPTDGAAGPSAPLAVPEIPLTGDPAGLADPEVEVLILPAGDADALPETPAESGAALESLLESHPGAALPAAPEAEAAPASKSAAPTNALPEAIETRAPAAESPTRPEGAASQDAAAVPSRLPGEGSPHSAAPPPVAPGGPDIAHAHAAARPGSRDVQNVPAPTGQSGTAPGETSVQAPLPLRGASETPPSSPAETRARHDPSLEADAETLEISHRHPAPRSDAARASAPGAPQDGEVEGSADAPDRAPAKPAPAAVLQKTLAHAAAGQVLLQLQERAEGETTLPSKADGGTLTVQLRPAAASTPVQPQAPQVPVHALAVHIAQQAQNGAKRFDIRLDPPELGRVEVRLDVTREGQVTTHLVVERSETLDLLQRDARSLERALQGAGLDTSEGGLTFSLKDQGLAQGEAEDAAGDLAQGSGEEDDESAPQEIEELPPGRYLATSGLDIRI